MISKEILDSAEDLIRKTKSKQIQDLEIVFIQSEDLAVDVRKGKIENSDYSNSVGVGIRVLQGKKVSTVSGSDLSPSSLSLLMEKATEMVQYVPEDPLAAITDPKDLSTNIEADLNCYDTYRPSFETLTERAKEAEEKALSFEGITNSEGAGCSYGDYSIGLVTSNGFKASYQKTLFGLSCCVLAGTGTKMERDYAYSTKTHFHDLEKAETIGADAATRTLKRVHPTQMKSGKYPVIFDPRAGNSLLGNFAGAISAESIAKKTSFLGESLGKTIFSSTIKIIDDPHLLGGIASAPFDMEGVHNPALTVVEGGILREYITHGASSRQLGINNNGRASRSIAGSPYPASTNMYMENGTISPKDMIADIDYGLYVTDTIGHGINEITGDYSIGASGFIIEKGEITSPVSEITIASNLKDMFLQMEVANDLKFHYRKNVPTLFIKSMTIAGK